MSTILGSSVPELNQRHCLSSKVEIRYTNTKGRYVVAKERLETGQPFFVSRPYSNVIMANMVKFACAHCRKVDYEKLEEVKYDLSDKTKKTIDMAAFTASRRVAAPLELPIRCERCQLCYYCSEDCKEVHQRLVHRLECELFAKVRYLEETTPDVGLMDLDWDPPHERTLLRHLVRIMAKRYEEKCIGSVEAASKGARDANAGSNSNVLLRPSSATVTYHEDVYNLIFKSSMSEEHLRIAAEAREVLPLSLQPDDSSELAQVLSRIDCNKFGLFGNRGEVIGSSLHPSASFVNHSCLPNAFSHIVADELTLFTLYPVEAGEELNISYIEPELPLKERRTRLKETYGFDCVCSRCVRKPTKDAPPKQLYDDFFEAHLNCPLCKRGLLMVPDDEDIRDGLEDAKTSKPETTAEESRIASLLAAASPSSAKDSESSSHALACSDDSQSFRVCNGCHKLQLRPNIPFLSTFKSTWVASTPAKAPKKVKRVKIPKNEPTDAAPAEEEDEEIGLFFKV